MLGLLDGIEFLTPPHLLHPLGSASCDLCNLIQMLKVKVGLGLPREIAMNDSIPEASCIFGRQ